MARATTRAPSDGNEASGKSARRRKRTPYGGRLVPPVGPPACEAGRTYTPLRIRLFGRMKRIAWLIAPLATSSAENSMAAIGKPPASAELHWSPRSVAGYERVRSHTAAQPPVNVPAEEM